MEVGFVKKEERFEFAFTLIPKSVFEQYYNSSSSDGASGSVYDFSSKALPKWMKFECCKDTSQCSIFFTSNKRVLDAQAEHKSEKFMFNRSFELNDFTIRTVSFVRNVSHRRFKISNDIVRSA